MEIGIDFKNIISYNENMAKGLTDKLFFLEKIHFNPEKYYLFVDFGCADGVLIDAMYNILTEKNIAASFIGYDISETMIELAKTKFNHYTDMVRFTSSWDEVEESVKKYTNMESVLILSSVIHEVYSYAENNSDIDLFWERVLTTGFKYVCVRDMMCSKDINHKTDIELIQKINDLIGFATSLSRQRNEFSNIWGSISDNNKQLVHFLLKYRWTINWDREVHENYFPIYVDEFLRAFSDKYNISFLERFRVPFLEQCWRDTFGIEIEDYTHIKTVFELKKN